MSQSEKVLFITTKNKDYSRVKIINKALQANYEVTLIASSKKSYLKRIVEVLKMFLTSPKEKYDYLLIGFFAQTIFPFIRPLWRKSVITDCYISLYDSLIFDRKMYSPKSIVAAIAFWLDKISIKYSHITLTDTEQHVKYMQDTFKLPHANIVSIPISADEDMFPYIGNESIPYNSGETFNVLFFGAFIPLQGVEVIIQAAAMLRDYPITFNMIGTGQTYKESVQLIETLKLKNIKLHGWQSVEYIVEQAKKSHLLLGIFGVTDKTSRVIPNKAYEALALGKPLITGDSPAIRTFFTDEKDILLCQLGNDKALKDRILWAMENYNTTLKIAERGYQSFKEKVSESVVRQKMRSAIESISSQQ